MHTIDTLPGLNENDLQALTNLLQAVVNKGASIGFFSPLSNEEAIRYWRKAFQEFADGERVILVMRNDEGNIIASAQYSGAKSANGRHRAEVQKVMVHPDYQRQGLAVQLMRALETHALAQGRELLLLDTRTGDLGELLYQRCGYTAVGSIPGYTRTPFGKPHGTTIYYKHLKPALATKNR